MAQRLPQGVTFIPCDPMDDSTVDSSSQQSDARPESATAPPKSRIMDLDTVRKAVQAKRPRLETAAAAAMMQPGRLTLGDPITPEQLAMTNEDGFYSGPTYALCKRVILLDGKDSTHPDNKWNAAAFTVAITTPRTILDWGLSVATEAAHGPVVATEDAPTALNPLKRVSLSPPFYFVKASSEAQADLLPQSWENLPNAGSRPFPMGTSKAIDAMTSQLPVYPASASCVWPTGMGARSGASALSMVLPVADSACASDFSSSSLPSLSFGTATTQQYFPVFPERVADDWTKDSLSEDNLVRYEIAPLSPYRRGQRAALADLLGPQFFSPSDNMVPGAPPDTISAHIKFPAPSDEDKFSERLNQICLWVRLLTKRRVSPYIIPENIRDTGGWKPTCDCGNGRLVLGCDCWRSVGVSAKCLKGTLGSLLWEYGSAHCPTHHHGSLDAHGSTGI
ncbi:hypothetical protein EJ06DRAFT_552181 [Trichodelitschia bisporula]|uniref:Uncharacterized protein n=1 Tax=Trichodelitschia bisporula TaxID=703511 RepID=A0A6G1HIA2_9PEZI|nr:hypothetical protein EJ06DRAFT_552181 [Trichodelitschia bisporula]